MRRRLLAWVLACASVSSVGQTPGSSDEMKGERAPQGTSRGGSTPAEGAIRGGSLEPDIRTSPTPRRDVARCKELQGKLRDECLRDLANVPQRDLANVPQRAREPKTGLPDEVKPERRR